MFPLPDLSALACLVYGLRVSLLLVLSELPHPGYRTSAALVLPRLVLLVLVHLACCMLVFQLLVVRKPLVFQSRKAMVAMDPVETAPLSALEYTAACGT